MNLRWARLPSWGLWWQLCVRQQWKVSAPPPGGGGGGRDSSILIRFHHWLQFYSLPNSEHRGSACTHSASCFTEQMTTPTVEWTRPSSRGDCLYYSSTLTQTLSDSCKHFMHFRRWSSPSISLRVSFTPPTSSCLRLLMKFWHLFSFYIFVF